MVVFYDLQHHAYESSIAEPPCADVAEADPVVCHCLQVRQTTIVRAVQEGGMRTLCELACATGAGSGCTACHRRLRQFFNQRKTGGQAPTQSSLSNRFDGSAELDGESTNGLLLPLPSATVDSWPSQPR